MELIKCIDPNEGEALKRGREGGEGQGRGAADNFTECRLRLYADDTATYASLATPATHYAMSRPNLTDCMVGANEINSLLIHAKLKQCCLEQKV